MPLSLLLSIITYYFFFYPPLTSTRFFLFALFLGSSLTLSPSSGEPATPVSQPSRCVVQWNTGPCLSYAHSLPSSLHRKREGRSPMRHTAQSASWEWHVYLCCAWMPFAFCPRDRLILSPWLHTCSPSLLSYVFFSPSALLFYESSESTDRQERKKRNLLYLCFPFSRPMLVFIISVAAYYHMQILDH